MKRIESLQNPLIKNICKLQEKSKERKKQQLFVIEGIREVTMAFKGDYVLDCLLWVSGKVPASFLQQFKDVELIEISQEVYNKLAYRESTEGVIAIAKTKMLELSALKLTPNPLVLVAENIEKPGNIGAILRTADAAKVDAVILSNPKTDLYNPNIIRSSLGGVFTNQIAIANNQEIISFLQQKNIKIYCATLQNSNKYTQENFKQSTALVVGSEASGLSDIWRKKATQNIVIPMSGELDSMNVSVAAAILLFEAKRQRSIA